MGANYRRLHRRSRRLCGGVITDKTTDAELRARGYSEADIAEVRAFMDRLSEDKGLHGPPAHAPGGESDG